ncbi:hypothetical protein RJT34_17759 [Clitoria ternatea]|uniref:Uncharacterized protein n=1 Tax=Clitoria ternatea TaxID=43366 RepID=A0AAN9J9X9_CLITE
MTYLKPLKTITFLYLFVNDTKNEIDEFGTFSLVAIHTKLAKDGIVREEDLVIEARRVRIHGVRFEIHKDSVWNMSSLDAMGLILRRKERRGIECDDNEDLGVTTYVGAWLDLATMAAQEFGFVVLVLLVIP